MARKARGMKAAHTRATTGHGTTRGLKATHKAATAGKAAKSTAGRRHTKHEARHI